MLPKWAYIHDFDKKLIWLWNLFIFMINRDKTYGTKSGSINFREGQFAFIKI